ncbi:MAG TPA: metalloregulator ArsR/SmtB family transcription factor [Gemmatimonadaceae bacterium]|nr:metalloregulator ArsR/SmtB family transcription factor [Gemmatimonadaceae bacterium]
MVEYSQSALDDIFGALAHPARRSMLARLTRGDATVSELAEPFAMSFAAVSKHVSVLERAALVRREVVGREHHLRLNPTALREAAEWVERHRRFWEERLDSLERFLTDKRKRSRT